MTTWRARLESLRDRVIRRRRWRVEPGRTPATTLAVPDANTFVHNRWDELPWAQIVGARSVEVLILDTVVHELDTLKLNERVRDRVRACLPKIAAVFADGDSGELPNGVPARFDYGRKLAGVYRDNAMLDRRNGDDRILASVLGLRGEGRDVVLVTNDVAMRLRARAFGIRVQSVPEKYENKDADPLRAENARLRRELDQLRNALPKLEVALLEGGQILTLTLPPVSLPSRDLFDILRFQPLDLDRLPAAYQFEREKPTPAQVDAYNAALATFRPKYEKYVEERNAHEVFPFRSARLELVLRNTGSREATRVRIALLFPREIEVLLASELPPAPIEPRSPELPGRLRGLAAASLVDEVDRAMRGIRPVPEFPVGEIKIAAEDEVRGPQLRVLSSGQTEAVFTVNVLSNFQDAEIPPLVAHFRTGEEVHTFQVKYEIRANGVPSVVPGEITVRIDDVPTRAQD